MAAWLLTILVIQNKPTIAGSQGEPSASPPDERRDKKRRWQLLAIASCGSSRSEVSVWQRRHTQHAVTVIGMN
jgi:hypothetical protein